VPYTKNGDFSGDGKIGMEDCIGILRTLTAAEEDEETGK
jgi:hypothetical protein